LGGGWGSPGPPLGAPPISEDQSLTPSPNFFYLLQCLSSVPGLGSLWSLPISPVLLRSMLRTSLRGPKAIFRLSFFYVVTSPLRVSAQVSFYSYPFSFANEYTVESTVFPLFHRFDSVVRNPFRDATFPEYFCELMPPCPADRQLEPEIFSNSRPCLHPRRQGLLIPVNLTAFA